MEKLKLHETLRIYLPGLLLVVVLYYLLFLNIHDINLLLAPAIFIGILLNAVIWKLHVGFFKRLVLQKRYVTHKSPKDFIEAWKDILAVKLQMLCGNSHTYVLLHSAEGEAILDFLEGAYFSKRYDLPELGYFRSPKSFGIMCYNLGIVCVLCIPVSLTYLIYYGFQQTENQPLLLHYGITLGCLAIAAPLFFISSKQFFLRSLDREMAYWKSIHKAEAGEIDGLILLWQQLQLEQ